MIVTAKPDFRGVERILQQVSHVVFDRLRIGAPESLLELRTPHLLHRSHTALAPQRTVAETQDEARVRFDQQVMMERKILAVFEGFEAVEDDRSRRRRGIGMLGMDEQAMPAES
jgi:hypothetical protein